MSVLESIWFAMSLLLVVFIVLVCLMLVTMLVSFTVHRVEKNRKRKR